MRGQREPPLSVEHEGMGPIGEPRIRAFQPAGAIRYRIGKRFSPTTKLE